MIARVPGEVRLLYRFNADVLSARREDRRITLDVKNWRPIAFTAKTPANADAVMALQHSGATLQHLNAIAGDQAVVAYYIERFARGRLLAWDLADDEGELGRVNALANRYQPRAVEAPPLALSLCRFAYLRQEDGAGVLQSGAVPARLVLSPRGLVAFASALAGEACDLGPALWQLGFFDLAEP